MKSQIYKLTCVCDVYAHVQHFISITKLKKEEVT